LADQDFEVALRVRLDAGNLAGQLSGQLNQVKSQYTGFDNEINKVQKSLAGADAAQANFAKNLSTTRYALYDVSSTLLGISAAALALPVTSSMVAIQWEQDFAQVIRTSQLTGDSIAAMREDLIGLAQTMPAAFGDITKIATLAGQLGIAEERVASFTQTVVKFATISGMSAEASATAFGRLDALLPDVQGNYEALGSSIAKVAVESVATEQQIVTIATQISSMGAFAGLTADEVVGLSGALASVGTQPELARGTVTRLFTEMSRAVSDGGEKLEGFARVAGTSGEQFAAAFGTERFGPILRSFIEGLADVERNGGNVIATLNELGISSVRDVPALTRLAGAGDLLADSLRNSAGAYADANEISLQYGVIAETTASKIQILVNNFQALMASIGGATGGPLNALIDYLTRMLGLMTGFVSSGFGQFLSVIVVGLSALVGVLGALGAAGAVGFAGIIAMQQAIAGLTGQTGVAAIGVAGLRAQLEGLGAAGARASAGIGLAVGAVKLLGLALAAMIAIPVATWITDWASDISYSMQGIDKGADAAFDRLIGAGDKARHYFINTWQTDVQRAMSPISNDTFLRDIAKVDEEIGRLASSGNVDGAKAKLDELRDGWRNAGFDMNLFKQVFTDAYSAIEAASNTDISGDSFANLGAQMDVMAQDAEEAKAALDALKDAVQNVGNTAISQEQALIAQQQALNALSEAAGAADASVDGTNEASLRLRESLIGAETSARTAATAILENGGSMDEATAAYRRGREAIIASMVAKGMDAGAAAAWADRVLGTAAAAEAAIGSYSDELRAVPPRTNTDIQHNARQKQEEVNGYQRALWNLNGQTATTYVQTHYYSTGEVGTVRPVPVNGRNYATGGQIFGPGTGTSDSIPAWLSNGEFVIRAAAVQKYGTAFMNAINSGRIPRFASGGPVGEGADTMGVVELGPKSLARLGQQVAVNVMLDDVALSRRVQSGDQKRRVRGDFHA
jgi:TP901 family phage tail tape measure protein